MENRPLGVTILSIYSGLFSLGVLGTGAWLFELWLITNELLVLPFAGIFSSIGILGLITSFGMWKGLIWSRWLVITVLSIRIFQMLTLLFLFSSVSIFSMPTIVPLGIAITVIIVDIFIFWYLTRHHVEVFFNNDHCTFLEYFALALLPVPFISLINCMVIAASNTHFVLEGFGFSIVGVVSGIIELGLIKAL